jgi:hypothetical protein
VAAHIEAVERKAASVATFAGLIISLTAAFGTRHFSHDWLLDLHLGALSAMVVAVLLALAALLPISHRSTLKTEYLEAFNRPSRLAREPHDLQGEVMAGLASGLGHERGILRWKGYAVFLAFTFLVGGLVGLSVEASTLTVRKADGGRTGTATTEHRSRASTRAGAASIRAGSA